MNLPKKYVLFLLITVICIYPAHSIQIGEDDRLTISEYVKKNKISQKDLNKITTVIARLVCPSGIGSAIFINGAGVFITPDHLIFGINGNKNEIKKCYLESLRGKNKYKIDSTEYIRGPLTLPANVPSPEKDWLIAKTLGAPSRVSSLEIGNSKRPGEAVIAISQGQVNWKGHKYPTPSIGQCKVLSLSNLSIFTDCDSDRGSSGAALIDPASIAGERLKLIAMGVWTYYGRNGAYSNLDCTDTTQCATQYILIKGKFREAIEEYLIK